MALSRDAHRCGTTTKAEQLHPHHDRGGDDGDAL